MSTPSTPAAIAWYTTHRPRIAAALPLRIGPATYTARFCECLDRWIAQADTLTPALAEAYICRPLRTLKEALRNAP
jgi:hypothetical protein